MLIDIETQAGWHGACVAYAMTTANCRNITPACCFIAAERKAWPSETTDTTALI